jgi:hypothetical protein
MNSLIRAFIVAFTASLLLGVSCNKHTPDPCQGKIMPIANFAVKEMISDTAFEADTIFRNNYAIFEGLSNYDSVHWKIGNDPRLFTQPTFTLSFNGTLATVPINFTAFKNPDNDCFPRDNGIYNASKELTVVEQFEKAILTLSPLRGKYKGSYTDNPADTFTVRIEYFDSSKYDPSVTGTKNFYWISNIPKGYRDTTSELALRYSELQYGQAPFMGYKALTFGSPTFCYGGKAWLIKDSLIVIVGGGSCTKRKFVGKRL